MTTDQLKGIASVIIGLSTEEKIELNGILKANSNLSLHVNRVKPTGGGGDGDADADDGFGGVQDAPGAV